MAEAGSEGDATPAWILRVRDEDARHVRGARRLRNRYRLLGAALCCWAFVYCTGEVFEPTDAAFTGWAAMHVGDVDGDGVADFALNTRFDPTSEEDAASTWVFSGKTASPLYALKFESEALRPPFRVDWRLPSTFAIVGDVDRDGCGDFCVGLPYDWRHGRHRGDVRLLSGRSGSLLWTVREEPEGRHFGHVVTTVGDLDADGVPDLAFSVAEDALDGLPGAVSLRSGFSGRLLARVEAPSVPAATDSSYPIERQDFGSSCCALGDVDSDGVSDFAVSAPSGRGAITVTVFAYSGRTRALLWTAASQAIGTVLRAVGDHNGDGRTDLLAISLGHTARVLSGADGRVIETHSLWRESHSHFDLDGNGSDELIQMPRWNHHQAWLKRELAGAPEFTIEVAPAYESFAQHGAFGTLADLDDDGVRELYAVSNRKLVYARSGWTPDYGVLTIHSGRDGSVLRQITRETLREAALAGCPVVVSCVDG